MYSQTQQCCAVRNCELETKQVLSLAQDLTELVAQQTSVAATNM